MLFVLVLAALAIGLAVLVAILADGEDSQDGIIDVLFDGLMIGAIMPIVVMALATAAFGNELEDKTMSFLILKPIARWALALPKLLASIIVGGPILAATGVVMTLVLLDGDAFAAFAVGVAMLTGVVAYASIFTWAGVVTGGSSAALGFAVVYVFVWEGLIGTFLEGVRYLSVRGYSLAIMNGIDGDSFVEFEERVIEFEAAIVGAVGVTIVFFALTVWRLRRMDVP